MEKEKTKVDKEKLEKSIADKKQSVDDKKIIRK